MKKQIAFFLILSLLSIQPVYAQEDTQNTPQVKAQGAILMDMETGRVLWSKNADEPLAMASTTKIMTAILAIESGKLDETVVASARAAAAPQTRMGLKKGETHKLGDLLYPLMLQSSNDSAIAIAEHVGGSVEQFCQMMTEKARELGAVDTVFETPNGLDSGDHHSTAYDMALITRYALQNEKFREVISTGEITIPTDGGNETSYHIMNTNRLLREYEGAIGVKSGFTGKAGQCFIGAAKKGDTTLISVVLASGWGTAGKEQKWKDTKALLNYGFDNYERVQVLQSGTPTGTIPVTHSREGEVTASIADSVSTILRTDEKERLNVQLSISEVLDTPVGLGQKVGEAKVYIGDELCGQSDILTDGAIARHDFTTSLKKIINSWLNIGKECIL